jgi:exopolyphosphatase/guanosine-5'-triphosphate,3'-diphosphate pyrophosphatase
MGNQMKLGVLDLGSNSFQLLAAVAAGPHEVLERGAKRTTLQVETLLSQSGHDSEQAQKRALDTVGELIRWARTIDSEMPIVAVGKTGLQDTPQGALFLQAVQRRYGITVELLTGEDEAKLTYRGVRSRLTEIRERLSVIDIGGGSVEVSVGQRRFCFFGESLPIGFLRIQELDKRDLQECVRAQCAPFANTISTLGPERWILSGGTSRAFGRIAMALSKMHQGQVQRRDVSWLAKHIRQCSCSELSTLGVPVNRAALFPQAASLLAELVEYFSVPAIGISTGGLRHGLVLREYERACFAGLTATNHRANRDGLR